MPGPALSSINLSVYFGYCAQTADCPWAGEIPRFGETGRTEGFAANLTWGAENGAYGIWAFELVEDSRATRELPWLVGELHTQGRGWSL